MNTKMLSTYQINALIYTKQISLLELDFGVLLQLVQYFLYKKREIELVTAIRLFDEIIQTTTHPKIHLYKSPE
jgi:aromatic ring-opening dioxygenase LigB subunit